jgi:hypothetical protein
MDARSDRHLRLPRQASVGAAAAPHLVLAPRRDHAAIGGHRDLNVVRRDRNLSEVARLETKISPRTGTGPCCCQTGVPLVQAPFGGSQTGRFSIPAGERATQLPELYQNARTLADAEVGHRSTTVAQIACIACQKGRCLKWDPDAERFQNDDEANQLLTLPPGRWPGCDEHAGNTRTCSRASSWPPRNTASASVSLDPPVRYDDDEGR